MNLCACMGPIKGEPMCPCQMQAAGLRTSKDYEWTEAEKESFREALRRYGWKGGPRQCLSCGAHTNESGALPCDH